MRTALIATLVLLTAPAFAADDIMAGYYGNTVVSTGGALEAHTHYRGDHGFDVTASMMGMSKSFKGTWALDGKGNVCRTFVGDMPPGMTNPQCAPIAAHKLGENWTVTTDGKTRDFTLKPGVE
ncbi:MAG TPA: hypothetical protein VGF56_03985 [Rhizomicrobium sp.]|jgi:hypothetical protein